MHRIDPMKRERATAVLVHFCHTKLRFQEKKLRDALDRGEVEQVLAS